MRGFALFGFVFSALVGFGVAQTYTSKFDNVELDQILKSDRLLRNYLNCLLDKGKCTPDGAELKSKSGINHIHVYTV